MATEDIDCELGETFGTDVCTEIQATLVNADGAPVVGAFIQGSASVDGNDDRGIFQIETDTDGAVLWRGVTRDEENTFEARAFDPRTQGNIDLAAAGAFEAGMGGGGSNRYAIPTADDLFDIDRLTIGCTNPSPSAIDHGESVTISVTASNDNRIALTFDLQIFLLDANMELVERVTTLTGLSVGALSSADLGPFTVTPTPGRGVADGLLTAEPVNITW